MLDLHGGKGIPIGTVLATNGVVIPNAVGVENFLTPDEVVYKKTS
jgi:RNA-splicing ligase RtcB